MVPLASVIMTLFPAVLINKLYVENSKNFTDPSKKIVTELHAASAVIKSKATWLAYNAIIESR